MPIGFTCPGIEHTYSAVAAKIAPPGALLDVDRRLGGAWPGAVNISNPQPGQHTLTAS